MNVFSVIWFISLLSSLRWLYFLNLNFNSHLMKIGKSQAHVWLDLFIKLVYNITFFIFIILTLHVLLRKKSMIALLPCWLAESINYVLQFKHIPMDKRIEFRIFFIWCTFGFSSSFAWLFFLNIENKLVLVRQMFSLKKIFFIVALIFLTYP